MARFLERGSTFCPLDGACRCWWASQAGAGAALCFHGGKCRRCGVAAGPASELVGLPAADAVARVTPAQLGEVAQKQSPRPAATKSVARSTRYSPCKAAVKEQRPKFRVTDTGSMREPTQLRKLPGTRLLS